MCRGVAIDSEVMVLMYSALVVATDSDRVVVIDAESSRM